MRLERVSFVSFNDSPDLHTVDSGGANDQPNQKDLTQMFYNPTNLPNSVEARWGWDEVAWNGNNTGDACALFDNDNNGLADYALCVTISGNPAVQSITSPRLFSCNDTRADRCAGASGPLTLSAGSVTQCSVSQQNNDPFPSGDVYPTDTFASCTIDLDDVGGAGIAQLVDVCSYPSDQPNSDPSDCVVWRPSSGRLEVRKVVDPTTDSGLFNLQIDSVTQAENVGHLGTTGEVVVNGGNHTVGETAGTGTSLANYLTSISCSNANGTGSVVASGSNAGPLTVNVPVDSDIVCTITNTLNSGSITIVKDAQPDSSQDFAFTTTGQGLPNFSLDDDADGTLSNTRVFSNVIAGEYSITESAVAGWSLDNLSCVDSNDAAVGGISGSTATINLTSGQEVTCTYVNVRDTGSVTVVKDVVPDDATEWDIDVAGPTPETTTLVDGGSDTFTLNTGSYVITEAGAAGTDADLYNSAYVCTPTGESTNVLTSGDGTSLDLDVTADADITCTFTNTRKTGRVVFDKIVVGGSEQDSAWDFTIGGVAGTYNDGDAISLPTGIYTVTEAGPTTYTATAVGGICSDLSGLSATLTVTENGGTCSFTNTIKQANLTIIKNIDWDETDGELGTHPSDEANVNTWAWNIEGGEQDIDTGDSRTLDLGEYVISETVQDNYHLVNWSCTDGTSGTSNEIPVDLVEEGVTCIITNSPDRGSIEGYKLNDLDGDTQTTGDQTGILAWTIELWSCVTDYDNCTLFDTTQTDETGFFSFNSLVSGMYKVMEVMQNGWTALTDTEQNIDLAPGEGEDQTEFINFQNGVISGYKFNDVNGNGLWDDGEPALEGWTINLDSQNDAEDASDVTDENGFYEFVNMGPGTYVISEVNQSGWEQTYPESTHSIDMTSNGSFENTNFGNQGRGTITVTKNVDTDGDGNVDEYDSNDWTWDIDGAGDFTTGSSNTQAVAAGTYVVSEDQQADYSVVSLVCEETEYGQVTSGQVTVDPGEDVECTFVNRRNTGGITVIKNIDWDESGQIGDHPNDVSGSTEWEWNILGVESNIPTGSSRTVTTGEYTLTENVQDNFHLVNWSCGRLTSETNEIDVNVPEEGITCTVTNAPDSAELTVLKNVDTDGDGTVDVFGSTEWTWDIDGDGNYQTGSTQVFVPGEYTVSEDQNPLYNVSALECDGAQYGAVESGDVELNPGDDVTCTFTNTRKTGEITFEKIVVGGTAEANDWTFTLDDVKGIYSHGQTVTLPTGNYTVTESTEVDGYTPTGVAGVCSDLNGSTAELEVTEAGGTCTFTNTRDTGSIIVHKHIDTNADGEYETTDDETANALGFAWGINEESPERDMGSTAEGLETDSYSITEADHPDYHFTGWFYSSDDTSCQQTENETFPTDILVEKDATVEITLCNARDEGGIIVDKTTSPSESEQSFEFVINSEVEGMDSANFSLADQTEPFVLEDALTGNYSVSETELDGWDLVDVTCVDGSQNEVDPSGFTLEADDTITCSFSNIQRGDITVTKVRDDNGDRQYDVESESTLANWIMNLELLDEETEFNENQTTDENGSTTFEGLKPGIYNLSETLQEGWTLTNIVCNDGLRVEIDNLLDEVIESDGDVENARSIRLNPGQSVQCFVMNQPPDPTLTIAKSNDASGDRTIGDNVAYTISVTASGSAVSNVVVTDLPPFGFEFQNDDSWTATSNINGDVKASSDVTLQKLYASPGEWNFGTMADGETITLTYNAKILNDVDAGLYPDLARAEGNSLADDVVPATAEPEGFVDENFVGTEVNVVINSQTRAKVDLETEEEEVLGASTSLPATGSSTIWILLATLLSAAGALMIFIGRSGQLANFRKKLIGMTKKLAVIAAMTVIAGVMTQSAYAADVVVRIEDPASTADKSLQVDYVTLDLQNRPVTVQCFKKGPSDGTFTQFGADQNLPTGGSSGQCTADSSIVNQDGTYLFFVRATAGAEVVESTVVSADLNTDGPKTPTGYSKKELSSCVNRISFTTGDDDNETVKVEIYRSDDTEFTAQASTRIATITAGSDEKVTYEDSVPDCGKEYYYAVRAFNSIGVGSGIIGDNVVVRVSSSTTTSTTSDGTASTTTQVGGGAIPVSSEDSQVQDGSEEDADSEEGTSDEGQGADGEPTSEDAEGETLGAATRDLAGQMGAFVSNNKVALIIGLIALLIAGGYAFYKKRG